MEVTAAAESVDLIAADAPRRENPGDGVADLVVGRARPRGHTDTYRARFGQPVRVLRLEPMADAPSM